MEVRLLAYPMLVTDTAEWLGYTPPPDNPSAGDALGEIGGRVCYRSWNRPNPATATNKSYLQHSIIEKQHYSVLEHAQFVFAAKGVSRAWSHEVVRHRHLQFSQASQRYRDESNEEFILPPELLRTSIIGQDTAMTDAHQAAIEIYDRLVKELMSRGVPRKRARQAARYVLPSGHATEMVISGNVGAWREVLRKRLMLDDDGEPLADLEFFQFGQWVLHILHQQVPNSVYDLWDSYTHWLTTKASAPLVIEPYRRPYHDFEAQPHTSTGS